MEYTMEETSVVGEGGVEDCKKYLKALPKTIDVIDVQSDKTFQKADVDLLWHEKYSFEDSLAETWIEVKADRYHYTGNYFFETISNVQKNTPGCFMYTQAKLLFYYFEEQKELHSLWVEPIRKWFIENIESFPEKTLRTKVGDSYYESKGRLVNRDLVLKTFPNNSKVINLEKYL